MRRLISYFGTLLMIGAVNPSAKALERNPSEQRFKRLVSIKNRNEVLKLAKESDPTAEVGAYKQESAIAEQVINRVYEIFKQTYPGLMTNKGRPDFAICKCSAPGIKKPIFFKTLFPAQRDNSSGYSAIILIPRDSLRGGEFTPGAFYGMIARQMAHAILNHQEIRNTFWDIELLNSPLDPTNRQNQLTEVRQLLPQIAILENELKSGKSSEELSAKIEKLDSMKVKLASSNPVWSTPEDEADEFAVSILSRINPTFYVDYASLVYIEMALLTDERPENLSSRAVAACAEAHKKGESVPIGSPAVPGHNSCYRFRKIFFSIYVNPELKVPFL